MVRSLSALAVLLCVLLAGCSSSGAPRVAKVQHIIVIMQENRSVDNLFNGFPGADTVQSGMDHGTVVPLQPVDLDSQTDLDHSHTGFWGDRDHGKMDGFGHTAGPKDYAYSYVPASETVPYWTLAKTYTFGDRMFASNSGPSFVAHQYMIAGQSGKTDENPDGWPWGCDSASNVTVKLIGPNGTDLPGIYPCLDYKTIADVLDARRVSWRYYAPAINPPYAHYSSGDIWSAFDAIRHIRYGPDWTNNVISPNTRFLTDVQKGDLAQVTWIVPDWAYSDHPGKGATTQGPDWVASLVNAVGASKFWDSTVIFISWDDWGGWYDHVDPPQVDEMGYGFRVPLIVVSPFARRGYVSHQVHEFSGFLRYTEEVFNLPSLGTRDASADDFSDCFDYSQTPQPYTQIQVKFTPGFFLHEAPTGPPDTD